MYLPTRWEVHRTHWALFRCSMSGKVNVHRQPTTVLWSASLRQKIHHRKARGLLGETFFLSDFSQKKGKSHVSSKFKYYGGIVQFTSGEWWAATCRNEERLLLLASSGRVAPPVEIRRRIKAEISQCSLSLQLWVPVGRILNRQHEQNLGEKISQFISSKYFQEEY